jgi:hypothetical protein
MQAHVEELCLCDEHIPGQQRANAQNDKDAIDQPKPAGQQEPQEERASVDERPPSWQWQGKAWGSHRTHLSLMGGCFIRPPPVPAASYGPDCCCCCCCCCKPASDREQVC